MKKEQRRRQYAPTASNVKPKRKPKTKSRVVRPSYEGDGTIKTPSIESFQKPPSSKDILYVLSSNSLEGIGGSKSESPLYSVLAKKTLIKRLCRDSD